MSKRTGTKSSSAGIDRGFEEIVAIETGHQTNWLKAPEEFESLAPSFLEYRLNLTALSSVFNLYFAALGDDVLVFTPDNFTQRLPDVPSLILETPQTARAGPGYISGDMPHAINHLVVGPIGSEEILLCACDDGDVYAYLVKAVMGRIAGGVGQDSLRPFFHFNVGASAWGLAIHRKSRYIAISSNSHKIDVFALATTSRESTMRKQLSFHHHNIPSVSFVEVEGTKLSLVSTDISGHVAVWDVFAGDVIRSDTVCHISHFHNGGWAVLCLDTRFSLPCYTAHQMWGCDPPMSSVVDLIDLTGSIKDVKDSSAIHKVIRNRYRTNRPSVIETPEVSDVLDLSASDAENEENHKSDDSLAENSAGAEAIESTRKHSKSTLRQDQSLLASCISPNSVPFVGHGSEFKTPDTSLVILQATRADIKMYTDPAIHEPIRHLRHRLQIRNVLRQTVPENWPRYYDSDHLGKALFIPELSLIVVASTEGRAALLTLTQNVSTGEVGFRLDLILPYRRQEDNGQRPKSRLVGLAVGPIQGQEVSYPLSAGQHSLDQKGIERNRRYRLMLTYIDGTILSYELRRPSEQSSDPGFGLEDFLESI